MGRKALTDEVKKNYIGCNIDRAKEIKPNLISQIEGYEDMEGEELNKVYRKVYATVEYGNTYYNSIDSKQKKNYRVERLYNDYGKDFDEILDKIKKDNIITYTQLDNLINKLIDISTQLQQISVAKMLAEYEQKKKELEELEKKKKELEALQQHTEKLDL